MQQRLKESTFNIEQIRILIQSKEIWINALLLSLINNLKIKHVFYYIKFKITTMLS